MRALERAFAQTRIRALEVAPALLRVAELFHETRNSVRMAIAQFELDLDPAYVFFLTRNRLPETRFFYELFRGLDFLEVVPDVGPMRWSPLTLNDTYEGRSIGQSQGLKLIDGWSAFSTLASWIRQGGIHHNVDPPDDRDTLALVVDAARAVFSGQMDQGSCYRSSVPWSDWFDAESFDTTLVFIDHATGRLSVLMLTDSP